MTVPERIGALLEEQFASEELLADCFTVEVDLKPGNKLSVFIDSDSGMTMEKCQKVSRFLESHLDANLWIGEKYVLEVSSPGLSRPLKFIRQYRNNVGRNVIVFLIDETQQSGLLKAADEEKVTIHFTTVEREGKKKKTLEVDRDIPYAQIEKTVIKPIF